MVLALLLCNVTFAKQYCFNIAAKGSNSALLTIPFTQNPSLSYSIVQGSRVLVIQGDGVAERNIVFDKAYSIFYTVDDTPTAITDAIAASGMQVDGNMAVISGIKANTKVVVYSSNGAMIANAAADASGVAVVDLSSVPSGMVIIKAGSDSFKLIK